MADQMSTDAGAGASARTETEVWGEIDGRTITFPMEVTRFDAATMGFSVPLEAARSLLPGDAFEPVEVGDGSAQLVIALCDYVENPWGDYLEINLGFLARPVGAPDVVGSFVYRMPVDQEFTCAAGNQVMGFPKTVEDLAVEREGDQVTFTWRVDGEVELAVSFPGVSSSDSAQVATVSYSYLDGVPFETELDMGLGTAVIDPGDVKIQLGEGTVADELRSLGLPKAPDFASWGTDLSATFQLGRPVA